MRINAIVLVVCLLCGLGARAQRYTFHLHGWPLPKIIDTLHKRGPYEFRYKDDLNLYNNINLDVDSATFFETLKATLKNLSISVDTYYFQKTLVLLLTPIHTLTVNGSVLDEHGRTVEDLMIEVIDKPIRNRTQTDKQGHFRLEKVHDTAILFIGGQYIMNYTEKLRGRVNLIIRVHRKFSNLPDFTLHSDYSNGMHRVPAAFATGSYDSESKSTLDLVVSPNVTDHIYGWNSGLSPGGPGNTPGFSIRGRTTLRSRSAPLFISDNFPYAGDIGDLNSFDIVSVNVLKDANSAGIWGAYSGNGVVVLLSNEGRYKQPRTITLTTNTTYAGKPDLYYQHWLTPSSYIGADSILFSRNYYKFYADNPQYPLLPAIDILLKEQQGLISPADARTQVDHMGRHRLLDDLIQYYYRSSVRQQVHLSIEGGSDSSKYYASFGYDLDPTDLVRNKYERFTAHFAYSNRRAAGPLEYSFTGNLAYVAIRNNNTGDAGVAYPYAALADASGNRLSVSYKYNPEYLGAAAGTYPLDWHYHSLSELMLSDNRRGRINGYLQGMIKSNVSHDLSAEMLVRWTKGQSFMHDEHNKNSFFVRDLVNTFAQPKGSGQGYTYPVPEGDILVMSDTGYSTLNVRSQLSFVHGSDSSHQWMAFVGGEVSDQEITGETQRIYGHKNEAGSIPVDLVNLYASSITGDSLRIPTDNELLGMSNRSVSLFTNASYSWGKSNTLYSAFRMDASNFVGVPNDRKWGSFWSFGAAHNFAARPDTGSRRPPILKLRISYGCNGNVSNKTAYLVTEDLGTNVYGAAQSGIANSPDPSLGWEKTYILNIGFDFGFFRDSTLKKGRISGNLDIYLRRSMDLLSEDTLAPSAGIPSYLGSNAVIMGEGLDLVLNSSNTRGWLKWTTTLLFSVTKDWISHCGFQPKSPSAYVTGEFPMLGKPSTSLFSYRWAGLDASNGDPQGYLGGKVAKDYAAMMHDTSGGKIFSGTWQPLVFGSVINAFNVGRFSLTMRVSFRTGYSFRRPSISYSALATGFYPGHSDYDKRWQAPGDEKKTSVPSFPSLSLDPNRDLFYEYSNSLVCRADNVRLEDLNLAYEWKPKNSAIKKVSVYVYLNNIALLWKANHFGLDPDATGLGDMPHVRSYSVGARFKF